MGTLQPEMIIYQGPIYMKQPTLLHQPILYSEPIKIWHIFNTLSILSTNIFN